MTRVGLCSVTFRDLAPETVLERAIVAGVEAIEWHGQQTVSADEPARMANIAFLSANTDVDASSYGSYLRAGSDGFHEQATIALDATEALGAPNIRIWAGTAARSETTDADYERAISDLVDISDDAKGRGITVSVEYHRRTLTEWAPDARALFDQVGSDNLFSYWQPVPGRGLATWKQEMDTLAPYLSDLHVFHWLPSKPKDDRRPLAEGVDLWAELMRHKPRLERWPHPPTAYLEFVRGGTQEQFNDDMTTLRHLCCLGAGRQNPMPDGHELQHGGET